MQRKRLYETSSIKSARATSISGRAVAREAVRKSSEVVELLERAFELVAEDDSVQPTMRHLYAALYEAETRHRTLGDWYMRTYGENIEKV